MEEAAAAEVPALMKTPKLWMGSPMKTSVRVVLLYALFRQ